LLIISHSTNFGIKISLCIREEIYVQAHKAINCKIQSIIIDFLPIYQFLKSISALMILDSILYFEIFNALGHEYAIPKIVCLFTFAECKIKHIDHELLCLLIHVSLFSFVNLLLYIFIFCLELFHQLFNIQIYFRSAFTMVFALFI